MQFSAETVFGGVVSVVAALFGGGWLVEREKNRGQAKERQSDELTKFRQELKEDCQRLEEKVSSAEKKIEMLQHSNQALRSEFNAVRLDFAQYRAAVRTMILQMNHGDPAWQSLAKVLGTTDHEVDRIFGLKESAEEVPALRAQRILVVDDIADCTEILRIHLERLGYDVTSARNGVTALDSYEKARVQGRPFDLLILDQAMPNLTGEEVAKTVRGYGDNATRIVFLTGQPDDLSPNVVQELNLQGLWIKPLDFPSLKERVAAAIQQV